MYRWLDKKIQADTITNEEAGLLEQVITHLLAPLSELDLQEILGEPEDDSDDDDGGGGGNGQQQEPKMVVSFQIKGDLVENVKKQAIELDYPLSTCAFC